MITVYFEYKHIYSEKMATFESEELYHACLPILEKMAKKNNFTDVSESYDEEEEEV
jgi:folate-dependent tRNA-U54 methylase TrmFO/GidA